MQMNKTDLIKMVAEKANKPKMCIRDRDILTTEEEVANGLLQFEVSEKVRLSIMDKIENY